MRIRAVLNATVLLASIVISSALIVGFFGRAHPAFDSFAHFRVHLAALLALVAVALLLIGYRMNALVAGLLAAGAIATTVSGSALRFSHAQAALSDNTADKRHYKLVQLNLRYNHPEPDRVLTFLKRSSADILTFSEVSTIWEAKLATLRLEYPYQIICNSERRGSAILSRWPVRDLSKRCFDYGAFAAATLNIDGQDVDVASLHLQWPWPKGQPRQMKLLERAINGLGGTAILGGDLNATTWSAATRRVAEVGLLNIVEGIGPTWLAYRAPRSMRWVGLPIDHIMVKGNAQPIRADLLEDVGSDHWPVQLEFVLRPVRTNVSAN